MAKPGPKKGTKHSGNFTGADDPRRWTRGNRSPTMQKEFRQMMRDELTAPAVKMLRKCMADEGASWRDRLTAVDLSLSHGHGKAPELLALQTLSGASGGPSTQDLAGLRAWAATKRLEEREISPDYTDNVEGELKCQS